MFDADEPDLVHMQRISQETVQFLRDMKTQITTGKIERGVVEALRKSGVIAKVDEHDKKLNRLFKQLTVSFGGLIHLDEKGKKD